MATTTTRLKISMPLIHSTRIAFGRQTTFHCVCECTLLLTFLTRLSKVIWEQATSPPLVADPALIAAAHSRSTMFSRWRQCTEQYTVI